MKQQNISRRMVVKSSVFGMLAASIPNVLFAKNIVSFTDAEIPASNAARYPSIDEAVVSEVVGVSHFDLDRLQVLVNARPELARATWDWAFGDWETAIGAASHVGRKDIVTYLITKGARPDIFTFSMLGHYTAVKSMIESTPGVQKIAGPHGISLLQHAKTGLSSDKNSSADAKKLVDYLESLGDADSTVYPAMDEKDSAKYVGDYKYGTGEKEGFTIKVNMRKLIALGKLGKNGGALYKIGDNQFMYQGTTSVKISFVIENDKVISLTVSEPGLTLTAKKIS
ncbi:MAG: hypothetical protein ABI581_15595 [Sediminibacterium sp.]